MKTLWQGFKNWLDEITTERDWELEKYLSQSTDAADLEHRMMKWEREKARMHQYY